jgi:biotin carboxylase
MCVTGAFDEKAEQKFIELGISMPVVVKPAMGAGSNFVKKVCFLRVISEKTYSLRAVDGLSRT